MLRQLLRVTKPGGKVWIGFIQEFPTMWMPVTCARWARCIDERENPWKKRKRARKPDSADQQNDQNQKRNRQESEGTEAEGGAAEEQASLTSQQKAQLKKAKMGTALEAIGLGGGDEDGQESIEEYEESKYQQEGVEDDPNRFTFYHSTLECAITSPACEIISDVSSKTKLYRV